jgi:hypothetical protein
MKTMEETVMIILLLMFGWCNEVNLMAHFQFDVDLIGLSKLPSQPTDSTPAVESWITQWHVD